MKQTPHLAEQDLKQFLSFIGSATHYLEYGSGGSTITASTCDNIETITTVETDNAFLSSVINEINRSSTKAKMTPIYVDIGPVKLWGRPVDVKKNQTFPMYAIAPWRRIIEKEIPFPDLIFIDGRFRTASFLTSFAFSKPDTIILFDDYVTRPYKNTIENIIKPLECGERMAMFKVPNKKKRDQAIMGAISNIIDCE